MGAATIRVGSRQFIRKIGLTVGGPPILGPGGLDYANDVVDPIDLSQFRIRFEIHGSDSETPNTAVIRVYNLKPETAAQISDEFQTVQLQAGYEQGNYAQIFNGTVKQFKRGKESNVDSYLDIYAAEGDDAYNFGVVNQSLAAGSAPYDRVKVLAKAMGVGIDPSVEPALSGSGGILPGPRVLWGMARTHLGVIANGAGCRWSIQNGSIVFIPLTGYLPGTAVVVNSTSGMIGIPEATDAGISVQMLLNPLLRIGTQLRIDNADITQSQFNQQFFPNYSSVTFVATTNADGYYRIMSVDHYGDTRGQEWYSNVICLSLDPSSAGQGQPSVAAYG